MNKALTILNVIILICAITLVIMYGMTITEHPMRSYVCGIMWMGVAVIKMMQLVMDIVDKKWGN